MEEKKMKYYADDHEDIWAIDENDIQYGFNFKTQMLEPLKTSSINPYWGGASYEYAKKRLAEMAETGRKMYT